MEHGAYIIELLKIVPGFEPTSEGFELYGKKFPPSFGLLQERKFRPEESIKSSMDNIIWMELTKEIVLMINKAMQ